MFRISRAVGSSRALYGDAHGTPKRGQKVLAITAADDENVHAGEQIAGRSSLVETGADDRRQPSRVGVSDLGQRLELVLHGAAGRSEARPGPSTEACARCATENAS
jgi:hypothetical protein